MSSLVLSIFGNPRVLCIKSSFFTVQSSPTNLSQHFIQHSGKSPSLCAKQRFVYPTSRQQQRGVSPSAGKVSAFGCFFMKSFLLVLCFMSPSFRFEAAAPVVRIFDSSILCTETERNSKMIFRVPIGTVFTLSNLRNDSSVPHSKSFYGDFRRHSLTQKTLDVRVAERAISFLHGSPAIRAPQDDSESGAFVLRFRISR